MHDILGNMAVLTNFVETEHLQMEKFFPYIWLGKKDNLMLLVSSSKVSIWMLNMWLEWLLLIQPYICMIIRFSR